MAFQQMDFFSKLNCSSKESVRFELHVSHILSFFCSVSTALNLLEFIAVSLKLDSFVRRSVFFSKSDHRL